MTPELARQLRDDADELSAVRALGLKNWRIEQALAAFRDGHGALAYAAEQAGIPLRAMIVLACAQGLEPRVHLQGSDQPLSLDRASEL